MEDILEGDEEVQGGVVCFGAGLHYCTSTHHKKSLCSIVAGRKNNLSLKNIYKCRGDVFVKGRRPIRKYLPGTCIYFCAGSGFSCSLMARSMRFSEAVVVASTICFADTGRESLTVLS